MEWHSLALPGAAMAEHGTTIHSEGLDKLREQRNSSETLRNALKRFEKQRISDEPHSVARERHDSERRGQALNGNGVVLQSVVMALSCVERNGKGFGMQCVATAL